MARSKGKSGKSKSKSKSSSPVKIKEKKVQEDVVKGSEPSVEKSESVFRRYDEKRYDGGRFVWAVFWIFVGVILLLNTTGLLSWGVWGILWRFWPVFIVIWGIQLIFGRSKLGGCVSGLLAFSVFSLIVAVSFVISGHDFLDRINFSVPSWLNSLSENVTLYVGKSESQTYRIEYEDENIDSRTLKLDLDAAEFTIKDDDSSNYMFLDAKYFDNFGEPNITEKLKERSLEISFSTDGPSGLWDIPSRGPSYDFVLGMPDVKTRLDIDLGAGKGKIDLNEVTLEDLKIDVGAGVLEVVLDDLVIDSMDLDVGAGSLEVKMVGDTVPEGEVKVEVGAGSMILVIPEGVGFNLNYELGVGSINMPGKKISGIGGDSKTYESDNYNDAEHRIEITVDVGVGSFVIKRD
ncbi:hypothetical protein JW710_04155 [Candidatus Dojkabacteria bacterium]|nr:hypothetical protein [Candidatus Dojkabacteria bacterium]